MKRKALFFDVDGTLLSEITHKVPESAIQAVREARRLGHLVFINSGRVYPHLWKIRQEIEVDGCLCGCGTYVEAEGEVLYTYKIPLERGIRMKKDMDFHKIKAVLESSDGCYMQDPPDKDEGIRRFREGLSRDRVLLAKPWGDNDYQFDKFCMVLGEDSDGSGFFRTLEPDMQVIDRGTSLYECVPKGHSKATAIQVILDRYGLDLEDAYVFGDSANDLSMFEYALNAVLMGKHDKVLEPFASFLTKTVEDDGVAYAMKELGII